LTEERLPLQVVEIHTPTIDLGQFLKWAGIVGTGGEGKLLLSSGEVLVNGEVETRRGRKLVAGDQVTVLGVGEFKLEVKP